jgi:hypothetical protein
MNKFNLRKTGAADTAMIWNFGTQSLIVKLTLLNNGNSIRQ